MKLLVILAIFLLIGGFMLVQAHSIDLKDGGDRNEFVFKFSRWVYGLGGNIADLTGNAIAMDWLPDTEVELEVEEVEDEE